MDYVNDANLPGAQRPRNPEPQRGDWECLTEDLIDWIVEDAQYQATQYLYETQVACDGE